VGLDLQEQSRAARQREARRSAGRIRRAEGRQRRADRADGRGETEWKLLQFDRTNPDKGGSQLRNNGNGGGKPIVRRYEFFKYTGPVVAPGGTSGKKGSTLSTDGQEKSTCPRDPDRTNA
jgi:hypothetical protein